MPTKTAARSAAPRHRGSRSTAAAAAASSVAFIPAAEAIALFKGLELGAQAARQLADWLRAEGPVVVQVLEAAAHDGDYRVRLRLTNQTVHGLVLLGARLEWPLEIDALPLSRSPEPELALGARRSYQPVRLPLLLEIARPVELHLGFALPPREHLDAGLWHQRVGKLQLRYQRLDQPRPASRGVDFAIVLPD